MLLFFYLAKMLIVKQLLHLVFELIKFKQVQSVQISE